MREFLRTVFTTFEHFDNDDDVFAAQFREGDLEEKVRSGCDLLISGVSDLELCLLCQLDSWTGERLKLDQSIRDSRWCLDFELKVNEDSSCFVLKALSLVRVL